MFWDFIVPTLCCKQREPTREMGWWNADKVTSSFIACGSRYRWFGLLLMHGRFDAHALVS